jgi:hypothetical protein
VDIKEGWCRGGQSNYANHICHCLINSDNRSSTVQGIFLSSGPAVCSTTAVVAAIHKVSMGASNISAKQQGFFSMNSDRDHIAVTLAAAGRPDNVTVSKRVTDSPYLYRCHLLSPQGCVMCCCGQAPPHCCHGTHALVAEQGNDSHEMPLG